MTQQIDEKIIYEGCKAIIAPGNAPTLPEGPELDWDASRFLSTGCRRGYVATWKIEDNHLYLIDINGCLQFLDNKPLPASWFTGHIQILRGNIVYEGYMGTNRLFDEEIDVEIENGQVASSRIIDNRDKYFSGFTYFGRHTYSVGGQMHTVWQYFHDMTGLHFSYIPGGKFTMGGEHDCEQPVHEVKLKPFLISSSPVTRDLWQQIMETTPWKDQPHVNIEEHQKFREDVDDAELARLHKQVRESIEATRRHNHAESGPAVYISWEEAQKFCHNTELALPSESQWEYACRAGTTSRYYWGDEMNGEYARYRDNLDGKPYAIAFCETEPNAFGLNNMSGNVCEWCEDTWHHNYIGAPADGSAWVDPAVSCWVLRGGSFADFPQSCRSASRISGNKGDWYTGFRVVSVPKT